MHCKAIDESFRPPQTGRIVLDVLGIAVNCTYSIGTNLHEISAGSADVRLLVCIALARPLAKRCSRKIKKDRKQSQQHKQAHDNLQSLTPFYARCRRVAFTEDHVEDFEHRRQTGA